MEENKFHIIVVDDTMGEKDPFIVELKLDYKKTANVSYFTNVDDAMMFVEEHMAERMIIIMDCRFGSVWQGVDAVMKLREKTSLVYQNGLLCERTDLMESMFLDIMNGRDIDIGSGMVTFDRELSRSCNSQLNIGNSKSFYGRSLVMALQFISGESGGLCG